MRLVWKLLRSHISIFELLVYFVANLVGVVIILVGVQAYKDFKPMLTGEQTLIANDYMVISKTVRRVGVNSSKFSAEELEAIRGEEFVVSMGEFSSARYEIMGSLEFAGNHMSTLLFFESIPDEFVDVTTDDWKFNPATDRLIPIILPRNYLNLYNMGFSQSQNFPQITESLIKMVEIDIRLSGRGLVEMFKGRVVGFSDRLNTILVPQSFMDWSNDRYAYEEEGPVSRIILEVENPGAPEVLDYLSEYDLATEGEPSSSDKLQVLLGICVAVIIIVGALFCALSVMILALSINLLLQKSVDKLKNLVLIGYTPSKVASPYIWLTLSINVAILALGVAISAVVRCVYSGVLLETFGVTLGGSILTSVIVGVTLSLAVIVLNAYIIRRKIVNVSSRG